jgi:hypothetical protein
VLNRASPHPLPKLPYPQQFRGFERKFLEKYFSNIPVCGNHGELIAPPSQLLTHFPDEFVPAKAFAFCKLHAKIANRPFRRRTAFDYPAII